MPEYSEVPHKQPRSLRRILVTTLVGLVSIFIFQYFIKILRQPRLFLKEYLEGKGRSINKETLAILVAKESLRSGIHMRSLKVGKHKKILHAGYRNFRESWARDFGFAAYGLLALEEFDTVKETLEAFFMYQTEEGQLPVKLHSLNVVTRFFHSLLGREQSTETAVRPKYISAHGEPSLDGQALLVIAALAYARHTGDTSFLEKHWSQLKLAMRWLKSNDKDAEHALLHQGAFADWADSIKRSGNVLYTNIVYWKALSEMVQAAEQLNLFDNEKFYGAEAKMVSRSVQKELWRSDLGYFVTSKHLHQLSSAGNLLAISWGLASPQQAESILKTMQAAGMANPVPTRVVYPSYPRSLVAIENVLGGIGTYHGSASWLWIGAWHMVALVRTGYIDEAHKTLNRIFDVIVKDGQINEVHGTDGEPLKSFWYSSEAPLTWNAGMVLYAYQVFRDANQ